MKALTVALALIVLTGPIGAQTIQQNSTSTSENFDIRTDRTASAIAYMNRFDARPSAPGVTAWLRQRVAGVARLGSNFQVDVIDNPELGTTEVVTPKPGTRFLSGPNANRPAALRAFLTAYTDVYGVSADQVRDLVLVADYTNPAGNMAWTEFEQRINGIPVFGALIRGGFTAAGELARTTGPLAPGLDGSLLATNAALPAAQAVSRSAQNVGLNVAAAALVQKPSVPDRIIFDRGPMADDAKAWLVYFPLAPGVARLAWATEIWGDPDAFLVVLDAEDGTVLFRKNLTNNARQAQGVVPPSEPAPGFVDQKRPLPTVSADSLLTPGVDFVAGRSFLKTGASGSGTEVEIPFVGQTVFFHLDLQVWGTGGSVTLNGRALLDGAPYCSVVGPVATGSTYFGSCGTGFVATAGTHTVQWELDYTSTVSELDETNNIVAKTFTSSASTFDVVARRAYMRTASGGGGIEVLDQPTVGETVFFHSNFQFTGTGSSTSIPFQAVLDGTPFCGGSTSSISPSTNTFIVSCVSGWPVTAGPHTLQWDFDNTGSVAEQNEGNNSVAKTFTPSITQGTQPATYFVYNDDSPAPLSPTNVLPGAGTQAPFISRTSQTLIGNEAPNTFNNLGWMKDGANVTDGNNVEAGVDRDFIDGVDAPVAGASRVFNFAFDPQNDSPLSANFQKGEVTDMFYWTNVYHDRLYLLGFNEAARNFQNDNFLRGGVSGDRIRAEAQDLCTVTLASCSPPLNNANFSTPADGGRGRMQMYIFPGPNPARSSGLDHDVLLHELTHGTSNRLHSNAAGLTTTMARGMGEGWSDFYARALLSTAGEDPNGIYTTGGWVTYLLGTGYADNYYYGIRRFPYAVRSNLGANGKPHNPLTFADIDAAQINTTDGAFPKNPLISNSAFETHNVGEVWCVALLEVRARFIARLGFATGNQRFLQFVTDGMKLDPANPTFLQGRDSIIAAANAGGGTIDDFRDIWMGFAIRGMGYSAQIINAATGSVVEAFDVPWISAGSGTLITESIPNGKLDPGEVVTVSACVTNTTTTASAGVTGTLLATGGVTSPSGAQSYGAIPPLTTVCRNFTFTVDAGAACGSIVTATLQLQEAGGPPLSVKYAFDVGTATPIFSENFDGVTAPALPANWTTSTLSGTANLWFTSASSPDTAPNTAFTGNPETISDNVLVSPTISVPSGPARLAFKNFYNLESSFDGGVLEIAIGAGAFQGIVAAGGSFTTGGYNGTVSSCCSNPLSGQQAWTGNAGSYLTTSVTMPAAASGQNIKLRWRMASDDLISAPGWSVDSLVLSNLQCGVAAAKRRRGQITSN